MHVHVHVHVWWFFNCTELGKVEDEIFKNRRQTEQEFRRRRKQKKRRMMVPLAEHKLNKRLKMLGHFVTILTDHYSRGISRFARPLGCIAQKLANALLLFVHCTSKLCASVIVWLRELCCDLCSRVTLQSGPPRDNLHQRWVPPPYSRRFLRGPIFAVFAVCVHQRKLSPEWWRLPLEISIWYVHIIRSLIACSIIFLLVYTCTCTVYVHSTLHTCTYACTHTFTHFHFQPAGSSPSPIHNPRQEAYQMRMASSSLATNQSAASNLKDQLKRSSLGGGGGQGGGGGEGGGGGGSSDGAGSSYQPHHQRLATRLIIMHCTLYIRLYSPCQAKVN